MANTKNTYIFHTVDNTIRVEMLRGFGAPVPTDGIAIWEVVERPRRVGTTHYMGRNPVRVSVPVLFEGWPSSSVEPRIQKIVDMAMPRKGRTDPPQIKVDGGIPFRHLTWVIEGITWDADTTEYARIGTTTVRIRQAATVNLLQYIESDLVQSKTTKKNPGYTPYVVKPGDTLSKLAAHYYKDRNKWRIIAKANNIRDPNHLKVKSHIKIPKIAKTK